MVAMRVLIARIVALTVATQAASASLPKASCSSASETLPTTGTVLLQRTGAVDKRPAPVDEDEEVPVPGAAAAPVAEVQKGSKDLADTSKKPWSAKIPSHIADIDIAVDNFNFGSSKNNDNNLNINNNDNNNIDNIVLNNNNNNNFDIDKDASSKGGPVGNFDFGEGPIKEDAAANARAEASSLKRKVEKAASKASAALESAAENERAIRAALDDLMSNSAPTAEDLKMVAERVKPRLVECERNFEEAQKQMKDLKSEVSSGDAQGAARADCIPHAVLLACLVFSGLFLHQP